MQSTGIGVLEQWKRKCWEKSTPGDNEVLVKIIMAAVNAADYRSIKMGIIPKRKIFGADIAGYIEVMAKNV